MNADARGQPRAAGLVPAIDWIRGYQAAWLRPDLLGALTLWALLVPQAIAYAEIAGVPPAAGLFATAAGLVGYALLGTSRQLVVSPTSSTAAISAAMIAPLAAGDPARFAGLAAALALLAGLALVAYGVLRLGFLSRFIVEGVQTGFMFGLGLTIIAGQLPKMLGTTTASGPPVLWADGLLAALGAIDPLTALIGFGSLAAILVLRRVAPGLPAALLTIVVTSFLVVVFDLQDRGLAVLGRVDGAVPSLVIPDVGLSDLGALLPGAMVIAVIAYAEGITVARQFALEHRYDIRSDQELVAVGGSNILSGLFQGFIVGGGASQSAANDRAGSRTPLASLFMAGLTVLTVVALLPLFRDLPQAVLGAIVVSAVLSFLDVPAMRRLAELRRDSFVLAVVALAGVVLLGVLTGLVVAVAISIGLYLTRLARPSGSVMVQTEDGAWGSTENHPEVQVEPDLLVYRLDGPLMNVNAAHLRGLIKARIADGQTAPRAVVVDLGFTPDLDIGAVDDLSALHRELAERDIDLAFGGVHVQVREMMERAGLADAVGPGRIHARLQDAVAFERQRRDAQPAAPGATPDQTAGET